MTNATMTKTAETTTTNALGLAASTNGFDLTNEWTYSGELMVALDRQWPVSAIVWMREDGTTDHTDYAIGEPRYVAECVADWLIGNEYNGSYGVRVATMGEVIDAELARAGK